MAYDPTAPVEYFNAIFLGLRPTCVIRAAIHMEAFPAPDNVRQMCAAQDFVPAAQNEIAGKLRPARSLAHSPRRML